MPELTERQYILRQLRTLKSLMITTRRHMLADEADRLIMETLDRGLAFEDIKPDLLIFCNKVKMAVDGRDALPHPRNYK